MSWFFILCKTYNHFKWHSRKSSLKSAILVCLVLTQNRLGTDMNFSPVVRSIRLLAYLKKTVVVVFGETKIFFLQI